MIERLALKRWSKDGKGILRLENPRKSMQFN